MNSQTSIDYGPLAALIGTWQGDKGIDIAPESDGTETNPYFETIRFEAIGDVTNAEKQVLTALHYRQIVSRHSNQQVFHDETGYWMWDSVQQIVMHSLQIPRAVSLIAGGKFSDKQEADSICLRVSAKHDNPDWPIIQSPFMRDNAKTLSFEHEITVQGDILNYSETTVVDIYGSPFTHTDNNRLTRINN